MKEILLTRSQIALVDDEDYELVAPLKWYAMCVQSTDMYYAVREVSIGYKKSKMIYMHRMILGVSSKQKVDHINHIGTDNRRQNIRVCTDSQNMYNQRKTTYPKSSIFKGVCWCSRNSKWRANIVSNGVQYRLGYFNSEVDAAFAYNKAALELFGNFANLNELVS